ncbi:MAG: enoyl-CoA hydratase [Candidatus Hydrogenedentes bacterium]|nr:enoyl-CoA hydratase [Candidatus Hydrogenedentota bacterium]
MTYEQLQYDISDAIATITLNRPDKLNAWTFRMEAEYRHAMADADAREDVRAIIVTGAGRGFCAGADMSLLTSVMGGDVDTSDVVAEGSVSPGRTADTPEDFTKQYSFPPAIGKPIIAAINGHAMGLGLVHTLYCDFRFAGDKAKFGTAFAQRGLIAEYGIAWLLPRIVGIENAADLLYTARIIDAAEAHRMGLVSRVIPQDDLLSATRAFATQLVTLSSPRSLRVMKRQIWHGLFNRLGASVDLAADEMMESFASEDFREGVSSFLEKRPPQFTGS